MSKPMMTVTVYMASCPPITPISSISTIFPAIKNRIPSGAYLQTNHTVNIIYGYPTRSVGVYILVVLFARALKFPDTFQGG